MVSDVIKKGMARPAEYISRSLKPYRAEPEVLAMNIIEPRIGPIHGVHPAAKVKPTTKEPT